MLSYKRVVCTKFDIYIFIFDIYVLIVDQYTFVFQMIWRWSYLTRGVRVIVEMRRAC